FREFSVATYTVKQGLSGAPTQSVIAANDGDIWVDTMDGLDRLAAGRVTVYGARAARLVAGIRAIKDTKLPDGRCALFAGSRGRIWISSLNGIGYMENDRYVSTAALGGNISALTEDASGDLWIADPQSGLVRLSSNNEVQQVPWETFGRRGIGTTL